MTVRRYAEGTTVSVEKSQAEMRALLRKHGASEFGLYEGPSRQAVQFTLYDRQYRFDVDYPDDDWVRANIKTASYAYNYKTIAANKKNAEWMRRWRARLLWLKATLEFAAGEGEQEIPVLLAAFSVLESGRTLGQALRDGSIPLLEAG
jgi:hypothetical protein